MPSLLRLAAKPSSEVPALKLQSQRAPTPPLRAIALALTLAAASPAAFAVDGCLVLLCFAAPSWRAIPQCVPPIRQVLRDLARGRVFPTCAMAGGGNSAAHSWAAAPGNCPVQYTRDLRQEDRGLLGVCDYTGVVNVVIQGLPFASTWWNMNGDTVTDFSPQAKQMLGTWDTQFDLDLAAWLAAPQQPAPERGL